MSLLCAECKNKVYSPGAGVIRAEGVRLAESNEVVVREGLGMVVCHSHVDEIKDKIHPLEKLAEGIIFVIDERGGYVHRSGFAAPIGTLSHIEPTTRTQLFGYLSLEETRRYFPNTCKRIIDSLGN